MDTILYSHPVSIEHDMGAHHPECPDRIRAVQRSLETEEFAFLDRREAPEGTVEAIERVHKPWYVESIFENVPENGHRHLDPDTALSPASGKAALRSVGGVCAAVDAIMNGEARNAFCALRPPGHHAEESQAMGFCFFNNVAVAARHAQAEWGIKKVAVVDFDVHHGNGTQYHFENRPELFYASSHQWPAYPGTGHEHETGVEHNIVNVHIAPGSKGEVVRHAYENRVLPALRGFKPELLIISAGFDAHARDPLAHLRLTEDDFVWLTRELMKVADSCCKGRVISTLEGGYDLQALGSSVAAHVRTLMHD